VTTVDLDRLVAAILPPSVAGIQPEMIRVLVVDASPEVQSQISAALAPLPDTEVVGAVPASAAALERVAVLRPDVLVMSMDDDGAAGLAETISTRYPFVSLIMTSRNGEAEQLRRAMQAGARQFLVKPLAPADLVESVRAVYRLDETRRTAALAAQNGATPAGAMAPPPRAATGPAREGKIFTFYSAKGGAGCTTLACNTAVALKRATGKEVALFDCGLLFGDVGVVLNLNPRSTIVDLLPQMDAHPGPLDPEFLSQMMIPHASGVRVLLAPASPEKAELVTAEHIQRVLVALRDQFDFVVIDTWPTFEERILNVLDAADRVVVPTTIEMPAIKNCKLLLDVTSALAYPAEKVMLVLNRADSRGGIRVQDVEQILQRKFAAEVVSDGRLTTVSLNEGVPFVMTNPDAPISRDVMRLAEAMVGAPLTAAQEAKPKRTGLLRTVFG
jgi:pilus assembly protein CpaE